MFFRHAFLPFRVACLNCAGAPISDVLPLDFIVGVMVGRCTLSAISGAKLDVRMYNDDST